ncbi:MAG: bifunctional diaminohydroxyphosphoribosylaminopyrimidine deaminase/5-amino-6-(5-phosphoribosylamino)uracil reductase RibD [Planctomycetes bacterium]|nr:bifunctional diaminohydroxyphosphoribosylaminopyrimidine deaminase/5-amino-6-(5-phosphoribosylamino)uracil reductase RibD [Planctomycetota bacterium]
MDAVLNGAIHDVTHRASDDNRFMDRALALAIRGIGCVEPNPPVGCVIVRDGEIIGEGFHERFGATHAEVNALLAAAQRASGATAYVTLEPCCHHGKTPPCTQALIAAGVKRVVAAVQDSFPPVSGRGIAELQAAGISCDVGVRAAEANWLLAPYRKLITTGRPWVIAKWAMTLDGKLATRTGDSQWISSEASRGVVHQLRGRVDAIIIGSGTAHADNPLLTARPADPSDVKRIATRVVVDSAASLSLDSRLIQTARDIPVLVAAANDAPANSAQQLADAGAEVFRCSGDTHGARMDALLQELGRRRMTNVLVEGGSKLLGTLFDMQAIDEVHVFIAPKLAGGATATSPIAGLGIERMASAMRLADVAIEALDADVHIHGRINT